MVSWCFHTYVIILTFSYCVATLVSFFTNSMLRFEPTTLPSQFTTLLVELLLVLGPHKAIKL